MLQFVFGRAASGKTYTLLEKIKESALKGESPVLLVPEQFSFESEKSVLGILGDNAAQKVTVLSFSRLCDEVERLTGGICAKTLKDSHKIILMRRAIKECADELSLWKGYSHSMGFAKNLLGSITEFKVNSVYPQDLLSAAEKTADSHLEKKLSDLSKIYFRYNSLIAEHFIDPDDRLDKLYKNLETNRFFENKTVFIDSFKSFSGQQFKILKRIINQAKDITISFTNDPEDTAPLGVFSAVQKTVNRIKSYALSVSVSVAQDIVLKGSYYNTDDLKTVERIMSSKTTPSVTAQNITVCKALNYAYEAEFVARNIRKIVKEKNARYSDFVVIARDTTIYEEPLISACEKNGVYCFVDQRLPLSSMPCAVAVNAGIEAVRSMSTEKILRFHKSGIGLLTFEEISTLENYTYLWGIDKDLWLKEWDMNPRGFSATAYSNEQKEKIELEEINRLRLKAITPLIKFKNNFSGTPKDLVSAIVEFLEDTECAEAFKKLSEEYRLKKNLIFADAIKQSWTDLMDILDGIVNCFTDTEISVSDFYDALKASISLSSVGVIPQMIDEVTFGNAERIRPSRPKYAFIMGANLGVFPKSIQPKGVFSRLERNKLLELEIDIPDRTVDGAVDEDFLVYSNVCCPTDALFISYSATLSNGSENEPSAFVSKIIEKTNCKCLFEPDSLTADNLPQTYESAFSEFCRRLSLNKNEAVTVVTPLLKKEELKDRISAVYEGAKLPHITLSRETAHMLFGKRLSMSSSKFDDFNRCRFMYFCKDGLGVRRLQPAKFDSMQRGSLIHFVLEQIINKYKKDISKLTEEEIINEVEKYTELYLDSIKGYRSIETPKLKYLVSTMKRTLNTVVLRLKEEFSQCDFEPVHCELKIGLNGDIPEIEIPLDNDCTLALNGIVDRIDKWNGYIRIVDYKTGSRNFKLPDVLFGQNMQMLIYLYALLQTKYHDQNPAGILYMPAKRNLGKAKGDKRMNGILPADKDIVKAMEKENGGTFIPKYSENKPSSSYLPTEDFDKIFGYITKKLTISGNDILDGKINPNPVDGLDSEACKYCDFGAICHIKTEKHPKVPSLTNAQVIEEIEREFE